MKRRLANLGLPLFAKELAEMAQLRRTYFVRVAFAILLLSMSALIFLPTYNALKRIPWGILGHGAQLLDTLYAIEWAGLVLFVPAIVGGALTAEKERHTLQLLFLTKLGPWTILFEKLLSRLVPVATFLLVSLPVVFIAYLWGGLRQTDLELAITELALVAFELASIALFCSAFCATSAGAFILSYVITALVFLFPVLTVLGVLLFDWCSRKVGAGPTDLRSLLNTPPYREHVQAWITATFGINLDWVDQDSLRSALRPFHSSPHAFVVLPLCGLLFLLLARTAIVRRAVPQPKHRIRRLFAWLDRTFTRLNDRYAKGILLARPGSGVPEANPVAWREKRRGNLGRVNYLIRVLVLFESPLLMVSLLSAAFVHDDNFSLLGTVGLFLWPIAFLTIIVRSAGLIAAEKARQTLDVLLTTPLSLAELVGAKLQGLRRMMAIVAAPIVFQTLLIAYLRLAIGRPFSASDGRQTIANGADACYYIFVTGLNLLILFGLAAQLAFLFGLYAKTQGRAVTAVLGVLAGWCIIPLIVRRSINEDWALQTLYLSPFADILVNEFPWLGVRWVPLRLMRMGAPFPASAIRLGAETSLAWQYHPLVHSMLFAALVIALAAINRRLAARVLLRPLGKRTPPRPLRRMTRRADPSAAK